ncbi:hypothetical protein CGCVW01_v010425 [Colletotrichum viniferum]|nr:hypothetical protein CGCVW01_v010425 [Colletotrichum viniferum]
MDVPSPRTPRQAPATSTVQRTGSRSFQWVWSYAFSTPSIGTDLNLHAFQITVSSLCFLAMTSNQHYIPDQCPPDLQSRLLDARVSTLP